ncbi:MAG: DUF4139 domain-containing protein [Anaerolineae bacterium]|nr:DUF4139 domain-containing protein [Anaerolineae bacterium]
MRKWMWLILMGGLLVIPMAQAQDDSERQSLTIYNQGTALVQDVRTFDLSQGRNTIDFTDVAASIDATSVVFKALTNPDAVAVLEQNFVFDLVGSSSLLSRYLDETISITVDDGTTFTGQLLSGRGGEIILRDEAGQVFVVSLGKVRNIQFPNLPDGLITRPTLRWLLDSGVSGPEQVELTYLTGGMNWAADYNVLLNAGNTSLDLNGWVTLTNTSGASYRDALVKLVAGDVNRLPQEQALFRAESDMAMGAMPTAAPQVEQREFFEYQLYEIARPVTVADNETKQVEFVTGTNVPAHTFYVYNSFPGFYGYYGPVTDQGYGVTGITDVQNWLEFSTDEDNGLGADLPAGNIRVYQEDVDGAALLIGENSIDHTPKGEDVKIFLGNAFDLVGERTQTNFQLLSRTVLEETYEIKLRNRKDDQAVEIRVPETLFRWSNWEILNSSDEYTKTDSSHIEFRVNVEPGEERVITYTVRYSWPG